MNDEDLYLRQLDLEIEMQGLGTKRFWEGIHKARQKGRESTTPYGMQLLRASLDPMSAAIVKFVKAQQKQPRRRHVATKHLADITPDVASYITVKTVLDSITFRRTLQQAGLAVATALEDEARFRVFASEKKNLWKVVTKDLESKTQNESHKRRVLMHSMKKARVIFAEWPKHSKLLIGLKCIDLLAASTKLVRMATVHEGKNKSIIYLEATEKTMAWMNEKNVRCELMTPVYLPTVIPPKTWTNPYNGGYHSKAVRPLKLVKTTNENYLEELHHLRREMTPVYQAINAVQATPWKINARVLDAMRAVWDAGQTLGDLPGKDDLPLPPKPHNIGRNKAARTAWKMEARKVHVANAKSRSKRMQQVKVLYMAEKFAAEPTIYFPMQLDFRGRMYAVPSFLNPQSNDAAKSLLVFANGMPLGTRGWYWLCVHGANCFGFDKVSLDARMQWVTEHRKDICAAAADPLAGGWWTEADKPWQFLAFCMEYVQAEAAGISYVSHLPITVDGTCNGLQNFSAMLRDEIGGAATNLTPSALPQDIYQHVADVAMAKVKADAEYGASVPTSDSVYSQQWLMFGFDRKATKRPVMVLPYGGTLFSARQYVQDYVQERVDAGERLPWAEEEGFKAAAYLAKKIWTSIGEVVIAARSAMDWLQKASLLSAHEGLPLTWRTPAGFRVFQRYQDVEPHRVQTMMGGQVIRLTLNTDLESIDKRRQAQAVSPNFVHSMDAACLMLTVQRGLRVGLRDFAMVHDSYGTLAGGMDKLGVALREAFVDMYQTDVLGDFRQSVLDVLSPERTAELPPLPTKGSLDLEQVKQSKYFFA
jgi:DNA-directed RNA polymerase